MNGDPRGHPRALSSEFPGIQSEEWNMSKYIILNIKD